MVGAAEFFRFYTRNCYVALERLDEKSLNKCLQEHGLKLSTQGSTQRPAIEPRINRQPNPKSNKPNRRRRRRKNSHDHILGRNVRKRKKLKALCYSDDENCDEKNKLTVFSELNDQKMLNDSLEKVKLKLKQEEGRSNKFLKIADLNSPESCDWKEKVQKEERKNTPVKNTVPHQDLGCSTADSRLVLSTSDTDLEIIKICTEDEQMKELTASNNNKNNNNKRELEDDEYDTREDDEDDRVTIIFDQSQSRELLIENDAVKNKFKNRGITNRKKQKLVKFKRKRMAGRNLAKVERKSKNKLPVPVGEQKRLEKTTECVSEESLREVCCLVKRLHELSRMISMLQKELSTNGKLTLHFRKVINAEQENFHREIRNCQNTIIKCYEKMLSFYNDTSQVAFEIGKRTSLSVEDVVNVISLCIHIEGQCESETPRNGGKQAVFSPAASSDSLCKMLTDNLVRIISQTENNAGNQQAVRSSSGVRLSPPKRQTSSYCCGVPPLQFDTQPSQQTVDRSIGAPVSQRNAILENFNSRMNYSALGPSEREKTLHSTRPSHSYNLIMPSSSLNVPRKYVTTARQPRNCPLASYYKDTVMVQLPQHVLYTINQRPSDTLSQQKSKGEQPTNLQTAQVGSRCQTVTPLHPVNLLAQKRNNSPEFSAERNNPSLTFRIIVPANGLPSIKLLENSKTTSTTIGSNSRSGGFPSAKTHNRFGANPPQLIPSSEIQRPIGSNFSASIRVLDNSRLLVNPAELSIRNCNLTGATDSANTALQEVLDPTIPQKLTMRNSRLQAGPVLNLETDEKVFKSITTIDESTGERTACNLDHEDSESRVYVCAQNECENPGVRICKGCHSVIYCSESCQFKHWMMKHKTECYQLKALRG